jgi:hypothetical protein
MFKEGYSPSSIRVIRTSLHKGRGHAVRVGLLPRNVCDVVSVPRAEKREVSALTFEPVQRQLQAVKGYRVEALFMANLVTDMRRDELLG